MIEKVKEIIDKELKDVLLDGSLSMQLLRCYSVLYLNGAAPRGCSQSQKKYYYQIKKSGMEKAAEYNKKKESINVPNWNGIKYSRILNGHISSENLTDERALELLKNGALKNKDFKKLPAGYQTKIELDEVVTQAKEVKESTSQKVVTEKPKKEYKKKK